MGLEVVLNFFEECILILSQRKIATNIFQSLDWNYFLPRKEIRDSVTQLNNIYSTCLHDIQNDFTSICIVVVLRLDLIIRSPNVNNVALSVSPYPI